MINVDIYHKKIRDGENSGLVFAPGISDSIEYTLYFLKANAKRLLNFDSHGGLFQPVWIHEGGENPNSQF